MEPKISTILWGLRHYMDKEERKILEVAGWPPEVLDALEQPTVVGSVDQMFLDNASKALESAGCRALELLRKNPGASKIDLAKWLNRGVSAIGLIMAIYQEAAKKGRIRDTAKDLLIREISARFPQGWPSGKHAGATLSGWAYELERYGGTPGLGRFANGIVRHLVSEDPSPGWKPLPDHDPLIDGLFDRYWPLEPTDENGLTERR
jgi:hypothetical protein